MKKCIQLFSVDYQCLLFVDSEIYFKYPNKWSAAQLAGGLNVCCTSGKKTKLFGTKIQEQRYYMCMNCLQTIKENATAINCLYLDL